MATKKEVAAIVKLAKASKDAAIAAGVRNPAPYGQVKVRFLRDTQTARFKLAKGEEWSPPYANFTDDDVEIGCSPIAFNRFEIVGLAHEFNAEHRAAFEKWKSKTPACARDMGCFCAAHAGGAAVEAPCDASEH